MHHAFRSKIMHVGRLAEHLGRDVDARHRSVHDRVGGGRLQLGGAGLFGADSQQFAGDQLAIGQAATIIGDDGPTFGFQRFGFDAELLGRDLDQDLAGLSRRVHDRGAAVLHRLAARGIALVGGLRGIGCDQLDRRDRNRQLLGGNLDQRRLDALTDLRLACEDGDDALGIDPHPGVEHRRGAQRAGQWRRRRRWDCGCRSHGLLGCSLLYHGAAQRNADDERARTGDDGAASEARTGELCHGSFLTSGRGRAWCWSSTMPCSCTRRRA